MLPNDTSTTPMYLIAHIYYSLRTVIREQKQLPAQQIK